MSALIAGAGAAGVAVGVMSVSSNARAFGAASAALPVVGCLSSNDFVVPVMVSSVAVASANSLDRLSR